MATLEERRERSKRLATSVTSFAIMAMGVAFLALAVFLPVRGGLAFVFLAIILGALGVAALAGGFFFHLVPSRLEHLAEEKREYDRREREAEQERQRRLRGGN